MNSQLYSLLSLTPSEQSIDYVKNKTQFQLHTLVTEQRHKKTWNLSFVIKQDVAEGLKQIFSVDEDIVEKFQKICNDKEVINTLYQAIESVVESILEGKKVYVYGCGATGRLAKQMESALWKPFWRKVKQHSLWEKLKKFLPTDIDEKLIGEMTGGDRALISALEGFEDLQLIGELQLKDRGVEKGDTVFCITEGGETSSVIGTILAAAKLYEETETQTIQQSKKKLYFIYNNPDEVLRPFERSRTVLDHPGITKINLTTGPQAITGSTRMQATTSETYLLGIILETSVYQLLKKFLTQQELYQLGFHRYESKSIKERLLYFSTIRQIILQQIPEITKFTILEYETYNTKHYSTYFAKSALITVFIDCAERSPTFRLFSLDTIYEQTRKCWVQVFTEGNNWQQAWETFLGRRFYGLKEEFYKPQLEQKIDDVFLKQTALKSLSNATQEQETYYDFSFSEENLSRNNGVKKPREHDLGVIILVDDEIKELGNKETSVYKFIQLCKDNNVNLCIITVSNQHKTQLQSYIDNVKHLLTEKDLWLNFSLLDGEPDPLNINRQILLKVLLNAHSTAVMTLLGRVVGNTMVFVNPSNLKLIGRATYLIMTHVNDTISSKFWIENFGYIPLLSYEEVNAVLFDAIEYLKNHPQQIGEVAISIVRILETLKTKKNVSWEQAIKIVETEGLENYLLRHNPKLKELPISR